MDNSTSYASVTLSKVGNLATLCTIPTLGLASSGWMVGTKIITTLLNGCFCASTSFTLVRTCLCVTSLFSLVLAKSHISTSMSLSFNPCMNWSFNCLSISLLLHSTAVNLSLLIHSFTFSFSCLPNLWNFNHLLVSLYCGLN